MIFAFFLAFFSAYMLYSFWDSTTIIWYSFWNSFWHSILHVFLHSLIFFLAFFLLFYLACILAFFLTFFLACILAFFLAFLWTGRLLQKVFLVPYSFPFLPYRFWHAYSGKDNLLSGLRSVADVVPDILLEFWQWSVEIPLKTSLHQPANVFFTAHSWEITEVFLLGCRRHTWNWDGQCLWHYWWNCINDVIVIIIRFLVLMMYGLV